MLLALAPVVLLSACAGPDRASEADELRAEIAALPAVEDVSLDYGKPVTLDSGKVSLVARLDEDATDAELAAVVATTYEAFSGTHRHEEGDLDIRVGDDVVHLRSFGPDAEVQAVQRAAKAAAGVRASGVVRAEINTQDVPKAPHVDTRFTVDLPRTAGPGAVLDALTQLERRHGDVPDADWVVQAGSEPGWRLGADDGFPDQAQRRLWTELRRGLPAGFTVSLGSDDRASVGMPSGTRADVATGIVRRHVETLGGAQKATYGVFEGEQVRADLIGGECFFTTDPVGRGIEQAMAAGCAKVTHPQP